MNGSSNCVYFYQKESIRYHKKVYQFQSALWVEIGRFAFDLFDEKLFKVAQVSSTKNRIKQLCERHGLTDIKHKFIFTKHCLIKRCVTLRSTLVSNE